MASSDAVISVAALFAECVRVFDLERLHDLYADEIEIWHNYDEVTQTREQGLRSLAWVERNTDGYHWDDIRVEPVTGGYVQQHTTRATRPALAVPTMMRVWCDEDRITRVEHYLDSARFAPLLPRGSPPL